MPRRFEVDEVVSLLETGTNVVTTAASCSRADIRLGPEQQARVDRSVHTGQLVDLRDREQPGVHHRRPPVGAAVDAAPGRVGADRRVREPVAARLAPHAVRADGVREADRVVRPPPGVVPARRVRARRSGCWPRPRRGRSTRGRATVRSRRRGTPRRSPRVSSRPDPWPRSARSSRARATATRSCGSPPTGTARPISSRHGICGPRVGAYTSRGDAPFDVELPFPIPLDELAAFTPAYTANRPVNAIPYVCAAAPGILSTADLPPITPAGPSPVDAGGAG